MRKTLSLFLALVLCLSLCACGKTVEEKAEGVWSSDSFYLERYDANMYLVVSFGKEGELTSSMLTTSGTVVETGTGTWEIIDSPSDHYEIKAVTTLGDVTHYCFYPETNELISGDRTYEKE